jgi:hypothetical protein
MKLYILAKSSNGEKKAIPLVRHAIRLHSLRKYFKTSLSVSGVDRMAAEAMLGHSLVSFGIESVYDYCITNIDFLREQYPKALPAFTFLAELPAIQAVNGEARRQIQQLQEEIKALKEKLAEYEARSLASLELTKKLLLRLKGKKLKPEDIEFLEAVRKYLLKTEE